MSGDSGDDTYTVDNAGDQVVEAPGAGTDLVRATITYSLGIAVENLQLLGSASINGTGNELDNSIEGNAGANRLIGGYGTDMLKGGGGTDTFVWASTDESSTTSWLADHVLDFNGAAGDKLDFSAIDANIATAANDAFTYTTGTEFTKAGQVRSFVSDGVCYVALNTDSDLSTTEMIVTLQGATSFSAGWMIA